MSKASAIIRLPAGRRTKWAVLVFWLIIVAVLGPLAGKLTGAEKNNASAWLPAAAESTKVLDVQSRFQSPNIYAAVVVYDRASGLTSADKAKAPPTSDGSPACQRGAQPGGRSDLRRADGKAAETIVPINLGSKGWNGASVAATKLRAIARANANGLAFHIAGPLGQRRRLGQRVQGHRRHAAVRDAGGRHRAAADHLPQPGPVAAAGAVGGRRAGHRAGTDLPAGQARPDRQRAERRASCPCSCSVREPTTRCCSTARYREELRRHEDRHEAMAVALRRAGPAIIASAGTVIVSLLTLTIAELNSTASLGPVLAIGVVRGAARHDDAAARPAGDLSAAGCSGRSSRVRHRRADDDGDSGRGSAAASRIRPRRGLGGHRA